MPAKIRRPEKKWHRCLKCNRKMWTDCAHRLCARCNDDNQNQFEPRVFRIAMEDGVSTDTFQDDAFNEDDIFMMELAEMVEGE